MENVGHCKKTDLNVSYRSEKGYASSIIDLGRRDKGNDLKIKNIEDIQIILRRMFAKIKNSSIVCLSDKYLASYLFVPG
jgi:hypothetical protein